MRRQFSLSLNNCVDIDRRRRARELVAAIQIDVLPRHRRDLRQLHSAWCVPRHLMLLEQSRQDRRIVGDDAVCDQPAALAPQHLLVLRLEPQLPKVGVRYRPTELMIILAPVQSIAASSVSMATTSNDAVLIQLRPEATTLYA